MTVNVNVYVPVELFANVPDTSPVAVFNEMFDGNEPDVNAHVNGPAPPDAVNIDEYWVPRTPGSRPADATVNGFTTSNDNACVRTRPSASVTRTVTGYDPAVPASAAPDNTPAVDNDTPDGHEPDASDHVYGARPPDAANDCDNATPVTRSVNDTVVTASGANTSTVNCFDATRPSLSVTRTVNVDDPTTVGVPDTTPAELNVNPAGNDPADTDHVNAPTPPTPVNDWL